MPFVSFKNYKIYYCLKPLFAGIKQINKEIAFENLCIFDNVAKTKKLSYIFVFGTVLGAVREKDFITHDEDIDLGISIDNKELFFSVLNELKNEGFRIVRWDRRGLMSILRKGEYIDIYIFQPLYDNIYHCCGEPILKEHLFETTTIGFKGKDFFVPKQFEEYMNFCYGEDWRTPIPFFSFNKVSFLKKGALYMKEIIKAYLPNSIFYRMTGKVEYAILEKYARRGKIKLKEYYS